MYFKQTLTVMRRLFVISRIMRKLHQRLYQRSVWLFIKRQPGSLSMYEQTFSSLLFSLCFSLCLSELPSLCFSLSLSLSLCFFSECSLCSLGHRCHRGQRSSAKCHTWSRCTCTKDLINTAPTTSNINFTIFSKC